MCGHQNVSAFGWYERIVIRCQFRLRNRPLEAGTFSSLLPMPVLVRGLTEKNSWAHGFGGPLEEMNMP